MPRRIDAAAADSTSIATLARGWGVSYTTVYDLVYGTPGQPPALSHVRIGNAIRIPLADVRAYVAAQTRLGPDPAPPREEAPREPAPRPRKADARRRAG